jgi:hypothetical protein
MIIKHFDQGWGPEYPAKQLENQLLQELYQQLENDTQSWVVINSVWYSADFHTTVVLPFLQSAQVDRILLVAMLDAAIPQPDWFVNTAPVSTVGYYPGAGFVDFWALFLARYFQEPNSLPLLRADCVDLPFMCLNRKPHWHRRHLYTQLESAGLLDSGLVSLGGNDSPPVRTIEEVVSVTDLAPNSGTEQNGIPNDITSLGQIENWQRCFLNIVTETVYNINQHCFVSEKIYKPILGMRPFLVYADDAAVQWLGDRGFETYVSDFVDITDLDLADPANTVRFLSVLCQQPRTYWQKKLIDLQSKIMYNKDQFYKYTLQQHHTLKNGPLCLI